MIKKIHSICYDKETVTLSGTAGDVIETIELDEQDVHPEMKDAINSLSPHLKKRLGIKELVVGASGFKISYNQFGANLIYEGKIYLSSCTPKVKTSKLLLLDNPIEDPDPTIEDTIIKDNDEIAVCRKILSEAEALIAGKRAMYQPGLFEDEDEHGNEAEEVD